MANSILQISTLLEKYNFEFPSLNERLKCILCRGILKNATQTDCGCKACDKCIKSYLSKDSKPCPNNQPECATKLNINDNIHPDHATNKEISNFEVKCPFKKCSFTSTLKNMIDHTYKCDYQEITCNKCNSKFLSIDKNRHDLELCEKRNISCKFCDKEMIFIELHTIHLNPDRDELCTKCKSTCPNSCSQKGKVKLKEHLVNCEKRELECPFHTFSCDIGKLTKEAMLKHMSDAIITHSSYIVSELNDLRTNYISITNELENQKKRGPMAIILEPSRELAEQTYNQLVLFRKHLTNESRPRTCLLVGGGNTRDQQRAISDGVEILVATPGRLSDLVASGVLALNNCRFLVLDECDGLLAAGNKQMLIELHMALPKVGPSGERLQVIRVLDDKVKHVLTTCTRPGGGSTAQSRGDFSKGILELTEYRKADGGGKVNSFESELQIFKLFLLIKEGNWDRAITFVHSFCDPRTIRPEAMGKLMNAGIALRRAENCYKADTRRKQCVVCANRVSRISLDIPAARHDHSILICWRASLEMNEDNPPFAFPNGYVYSARVRICTCACHGRFIRL